MKLPQITRRRPMTKYVGTKRTRVAVDRERRRKGQKAVERMRGWHRDGTSHSPVGISWLGHCAHAAAQAHGHTASIWPTAAEGWRRTPARHRHTGRLRKTPPRGALVFWTGGSHDYGHVAISNGRGKVWGVDLPDSGRIGLVDIDTPTNKWGLVFQGWAFADRVANW